MGDILGTIKVMEGRIVTKKGDIKEVWSRSSGDSKQFIIYNGVTYRLLDNKEIENASKKKYEEIEDDINTDDFE